MKDDIFSVRFINDINSVNWIQINMNKIGLDKSILSIINEDKFISHFVNLGENLWYNFDYCNIFKYDIKILQFNNKKIKLLEHKKFNIKDHNFNITLKSNKDDIKIWKYYLWLIQLKMNVKFNIIENEDFISQDNGDYIEISRDAYTNYLNKNRIFTSDYSSITIITTLFDVLNDNKDILNHPWLNSNFYK